MRNSFSRGALLLGAILLMALLIRLSGVPYGLPYHVYGDEETNVYGALQMLQLHTLLPVFHQQDFAILYEPPLLAYVYAVAFVPTLALTYLLWGMPGLHTFIAQLTLDPSVLWYVSRTIVVLISVAGIWLLYKFARDLFRDEAPALMSALFFATSFLSTTIGSSARHWMPGVVTSIAALYFAHHALAYPHTRRTRMLLWSGIMLGLSFSFSYLLFYIPPIALLIIYYNWQTDNLPGTVRRVMKDALTVMLPFITLSLLIIVADPYPLVTQVFNHVIPASEKSLYNFLGYYLQTLFDFEPPLFIGAALGIALLIVRKSFFNVALFGSFFAASLAAMYHFFPNIARYLVPLIPMLSLMAGYGVWQLSRALAPRRSLLPLGFFAALVVVYAAAVFGRYEVLLWRDDTRVQAMQWIEANIEAGSTVITDSDRLRLFGTPASLEAEQRLSPEALRGADKVLLSGANVTGPRYNLFTLFAASSSAQAALVNAALTSASGTVYFIADAWASPVDALLPPKTVLEEWRGSSALGQRSLFTVDGAEDSRGMPLLELLYNSPSLGPDVSVYIVDKKAP